eukprot:COSAG06_NODE_2578_length_6622_cov_18.934386_5_plen_86_part_00
MAINFRARRRQLYLPAHVSRREWNLEADTVLGKVVRLNGVTLAASKSGQLPKMSGQHILGNVHTDLAGHAIKFAVLEPVQGIVCA